MFRPPAAEATGASGRKEEIVMIIELGRVSAETKGNSPGPVIEPLTSLKIMRFCLIYQ
jgi:hypothetical protein